MRLSVILPSNRPEGLEAFLKSLGDYNKNEIEIIIVKDYEELDSEYVSYQGNIVTVHCKRSLPVNIGNLQEKAYDIARGQWIALANDDCICETPDWDLQLFKELDKFENDRIALLWFNDKLFGNALSCFPIVSKKALHAINFYPTPYERYKIDDTLYAIFPYDRKVFLKDIVFRHLNTEYSTGKFVHPEIGERDSKIFDEQIQARLIASAKLRSMANESFTGKVLVGIPSGAARYGEFNDFVNILQKPENTFFTYARGQSPAKNRNLIIERALETDCTHVLFLDDDMAFEPDILVRLLSHDKDIVTGLYYLRSYPHPPALFDSFNGKETANIKYLNGDRGLIPVVAAGLGCCLIKTDVFRKMEKPWIRLGELEADMWCDDVGFFIRAHSEIPELKMYCDLDVRVGHMSQVTIWPTIVDNKWHTTYSTYGSGNLSAPQLLPVEDQ